MVALADDDLLGKKFEENGVCLEINEFYQGKKVEKKEEAIKKLKKAFVANIVGQNSVDIGIKAGIIKKENILYIEKIPHAQSVKI